VGGPRAEPDRLIAMPSRSDHRTSPAAAATRVRVDPAAPAGVLALTGDVGPVLESRCFWPPVAAEPCTVDTKRGRAGAIRAVDVARDGLPFGIGSAAVGHPAEHAVGRLGEYVLIDGQSWWTPAELPTSSRAEPSDAPVLTPFLLRVDQLRTAVAELDSPVPVALVEWLAHLVRVLVESGACPTGAVGAQIVADLPAVSIVDKHLIRAPLASARPADGHLITDASHVDTFFRRNATRAGYPPDTRCTLVMVGVVAAAEPVAAAWGPEFLGRCFYTMPGAGTHAVLHHTHGLVMAGPSTGDPLSIDAASARLAAAADPAGSAHVQALHIESGTRLHRAQARLGALGMLRLDDPPD
jgi:hypothetical protein